MKMLILKKNLLLGFLTLCTPLFLFAQNRNLKGIVVDKVLGDGLIGATIEANPGKVYATTDLDGNFSLSLPDNKTYTLKISYVGYVTETYTVVLNAKTVMPIKFALKENVTDFQEFVITDYKTTRSEKSVSLEIKNSGLVVNGISAELIGKLPDKNAAEVVRRIPGVTVLGDKYIVVRGLPQRYNYVFINGVTAPSFDPDSRAFSFDILPSGVIDRVMLYKTAAPELPSDFAGGMAKITTATMPDKNGFEISVSGGYRIHTTFQRFERQEQEGLSWLGFGESYNQLPDGLPPRLDFPTPTLDQRREWTTLFNNNYNFAEDKINAMPDLSINALLNRRLKLKNGQEIGSITNVSYSNSYNRVIFRRNVGNLEDGQDEFGVTLRNAFRFSDETFTNSIRQNVMQNFTYAPSKRNRYDLKMLFTGNTQFIATERKGQAEPNAPDGVGITRDNQFLQYFNINRYRRVFSSQLVGLHQPNEKLKIDWVAGYMASNYLDWDRKTITGIRFNDPFGVSTEPDFAFLIPAATPDAIRYSRWFYDLPENTLTGSLNAEYKFNPKKPNALILKTGFFTENKTRELLVRQLGLNREGAENLIGEFYADFNSYEGITNTAAGYVGIDIPFNLRWKLYTGVRYEYYTQTIISVGLKNFGGAEKIVRTANDLANSLFSSFNLTYKINNDNLMRFAYARTSNRPEFREIAPFEYLDLENFLTAYGNVSLKLQSLIDNFDLRFENYSTNSNYSIGAFYKNFTDPIEIAFGIRGQGDNTTPINAHRAQTYGVEFEFRRSLANKSNASKGLEKILTHTDIILNTAFIQSIVEPYKDVPDSLIRPMLGQSPYVINLILSYSNPESNTSFNLAFNRMGPRIVFIGDNIQNFTIYELPRNILDVTLGQKINKWLYLEVSAQNILNAQFVHVQDVNRDEKLEAFEGYEYQLGGDNVYRAYYENPQFQITARFKIQ